MWFRERLEELTSLGKPVANALCFQCCWFVNVLGGNRWGLLATSLFLVSHLLFFLKGRRELIVIFLVCATGILIDAVLIRTGVLQTLDNSQIPPVWLMCLWLSFSLTLCHSLNWVWKHLLFAAIVGAMAGPSSYGAGVAFGAMNFGLSSGPVPWLEILIYGVVWSVLLPIVALWVRWVDQSQTCDNNVSDVCPRSVKHHES